MLTVHTLYTRVVDLFIYSCFTIDNIIQYNISLTYPSIMKLSENMYSQQLLSKNILYQNFTLLSFLRATYDSCRYNDSNRRFLLVKELIQ